MRSHSGPLKIFWGLAHMIPLPGLTEPRNLGHCCGAIWCFSWHQTAMLLALGLRHPSWPAALPGLSRPLIYQVKQGDTVALPYPGKNIPTARPSIRKVDIRSLSIGLGGPELPYPSYQFAGGRAKLEYPRHNPFLHVPPYY